MGVVNDVVMWVSNWSIGIEMVCMVLVNVVMVIMEVIWVGDVGVVFCMFLIKL